MNEIERIRDQLKRAFHGDAWHGPSLREVLDGVSARQAASRPLGGAHTIWELVRHITAWTDIARHRLAQERIPEATPEEDWPPVGGSDETSWQSDLEDLYLAHDKLQEALASFAESRLPENVPGRDHSFYGMLHGVVQHGLYHAGQIAMLKKAKA
jgi:hypothetical protein